MNLYETMFSKYNLSCAQVLLTEDELSEWDEDDEDAEEDGGEEGEEVEGEEQPHFLPAIARANLAGRDFEASFEVVSLHSNLTRLVYEVYTHYRHVTRTTSK